MQTNPPKKPATSVLFCKVRTCLKRELARQARRCNLSTNEYLNRLLADHLERPDLATLPRKPPGRKPSLS